MGNAKIKLRGKAKRLRVYFDESAKAQGKPLHRFLLEKLKKEGIAGATVFRAIEGFGASTRIHSARLMDIMEDLPLVLEVVEKPSQAIKVLQWVEEVLPESCLVTVEDVRVLHYHAPAGKHTSSRSFS